MNLEKLGPLVLALLVVLTACEKGGSSQDGDDSDDDNEAPPVPVEISKPARGDVYAIYKGTAPIEAYADAEVVTKVGGEVREILVEEGDEVQQGQVLARLDGDRLRLELNESDARLNKLQNDYQRNVELSEKGLISAGDFEKIKYEMQALQAKHNLASLELDYTQIRAPIAGVVSARYTKLGTSLAAGEPVFRITSLDPLVTYLFIPEREFSNVKVGQKVSLDIDALDAAPVVAKVTRVSPVVDPGTGTFKVTVELHDPERNIKPGMFARAGIVYDRHENALKVPRSAIVEYAGDSAIFVVDDGVAQRKVVTVGLSGDGMVEILSGLLDDEDIVTVGQVGLKPGAPVTVIGANQIRNTNEAAEAVADQGPAGNEDNGHAATD
ncbi:MAG TPA: efflux RND transporter periplasmic adaptor subunit [Woeseiaceae bacterium]|nr:efflux RND transporter periplasmic adaptor subunit [Woeseiaceae bacterium]